MNDKFTEIHDKARIDNYLAGTSQSPDRVKPGTVGVKTGSAGAKRPSATPTGWTRRSARPLGRRHAKPQAARQYDGSRGLDPS